MVGDEREGVPLVGAGVDAAVAGADVDAGGVALVGAEGVAQHRGPGASGRRLPRARSTSPPRRGCGARAAGRPAGRAACRRPAGPPTPCRACGARRRSGSRSRRAARRRSTSRTRRRRRCGTRPKWFCAYSRSGPAGVDGDLVHALPVLRRRVGPEGDADAPVARLPLGAAVLADVDAAGAHGDRDAVGRRVGQHRVHRATPAAGLPGRPVRVVVQPADQLEAAAAVGAAPQRVRLAAGPDDARAVGGVGAQLPHPGQGRAGVLREPDGARGRSPARWRRGRRTT